MAGDQSMDVVDPVVQSSTADLLNEENELTASYVT